MLNCFLTTCNSRRRPAFGNLNSEASVLPVRRDVNMKVLTVSLKPKAVVIERFVVRHKPSNFCSQLLSNRQQKFRLRSHDELIRYTDDLFKISLQHTDKFDCQIPPLSHFCAMF